MLKRVLVVLVLAGLFAVSIAELASAKPLPTGTRVDDGCLWLYGSPDAGTTLCVDAGAACTIWLRHQTIAGPRDDCIATA